MEKKVNKKVSAVKLILALIVGIIVIVLLSKVYEFGMNVLYGAVYGEDAEYYGATETITFGKEESNNTKTSGGIKMDSNNTFTVYSDGSSWEYQASDWLVGKSAYMIENYEVETKLTNSEMYFNLDETYVMYLDSYDEFFNDYTAPDANQLINNAVRNDLSLPVKMEGQIISIEENGNLILIQDMYTTEEAAYAYDHGLVPDITQQYIDISMVNNKDDFYVNDYVTIFAQTIGKIPMQDGSYCPYIVAVHLELQ